ncbi:MAG: hypothetical protein CW338_07030 [Clostridiales bacterium]|nr:hypothetical protein [Clostridiales bacterium]
MFGHRSDGKLIKNMDPIVAFTPYLMPMRCDAQVFLNTKAPYDTLARYIVEQGQQGRKISFMELIIAAYVRTIAENPVLNRFVVNKRVYARTDLSVSFAMLQDTGTEELAETTIKCNFDPRDTVFDVADRINAVIEENRKIETNNSVDKIAKLALNPVFANLIMWFARFTDKHGIMPRALIDFSPFHASMFITNVASIGLPAVNHHIYNFGTVSCFIGVGCPERNITVENGVNVRHRTLPLGVVVDERMASGAEWARMMVTMNKYLKNPSLLETPPEQVKFDEGHEYSLPKKKDRKEKKQKETA